MTSFAETKNYKKLFLFETSFVQKFFHDGKIDRRNMYCLKNQNVLDYDIRLMPEYYSVEKEFFNLSFRKINFATVASRLQILITNVNNDANQTFWDNWMFFAPENIVQPKQNDSGMHICFYAFLSRTESYFQFDDSFIDNGRKALAKLLSTMSLPKSIFKIKGVTHFKSENKKMPAYPRKLIILRQLPDSLPTTFDYLNYLEAV